MRRCARLLSNSNAAWDFDVLVVGGGVVGSCLAARVSRTVPSAKIGLIESKSQEAQVPDVRVYALSPRSIAELQAIGVWADIQPRTQPFDSMQIWDEHSAGLLHFSASDLGVPHLGVIAENNILQSALFEFVQSQAMVDVITNRVVKDVRPALQAGVSAARGPAHVVFNDGSHVTARVVVGADGANSAVRRLMGLSAYGWDYGQHALVATVQLNAPNTTAWQRYLSTGPLALLPLWDNMSSIVWSTTPQMAAELKSLTPQEFITRLNETLQSPPAPTRPFSPISMPSPLNFMLNESRRLYDAAVASATISAPWKCPPTVTDMKSALVAFPLRFEHVTSYVTPRVALIGDSAHTVHPMAGQGLNLGILDASALASVLEEGNMSGADLGDVFLLQKYDKMRKSKNMAMMSSLDALHRIYGTQDSVLALVRGLGMLGLNNMALLKNSVARFAMGLEPY